jgi:predicted signal transduction protein with EAL and GGDEF domain
MTVSVGVGIYPTHGEEAETLMKSADLALYEAKRTGKNGYRIASRTNCRKGHQAAQLEKNKHDGC